MAEATPEGREAEMAGEIVPARIYDQADHAPKGKYFIAGNDNIVFMVDFDVAVTTSEGAEGKAKAPLAVTTVPVPNLLFMLSSSQSLLPTVRSTCNKGCPATPDCASAVRVRHTLDRQTARNKAPKDRFLLLMMICLSYIVVQHVRSRTQF